jgi:hypothetical protein
LTYKGDHINSILHHYVIIYKGAVIAKEIILSNEYRYFGKIIDGECNA